MGGRECKMPDDQILVNLTGNVGLERKYNSEKLRGLGKGIWDGVDAQEYVNSLRQEWQPPFDSSSPTSL